MWTPGRRASKPDNEQFGRTTQIKLVCFMNLFKMFENYWGSFWGRCAPLVFNGAEGSPSPSTPPEPAPEPTWGGELWKVKAKSGGGRGGKSRICFQPH